MRYILKVCTGQYEDYHEYELCVFDDKEEAERVYEASKALNHYLVQRAEAYIGKYGDGYDRKIDFIEHYLAKLGVTMYFDDFY